MRLLARSLAAGLLLVATAGCDRDSPLVIVPPTERQPIVFVHGLGGSAADWAPVIQRFKTAGWVDRELSAATYSSFASNASVAAAIATRVDSVRDATGWDKVHIVAFSMGSLSSRYYLKNLGGTARVDAWVSVAGPNHGTETAEGCAFTQCVEARPGSAFLTALNAGTQVPAGVRSATWWSPCDEVIVPAESTTLEGATNNMTACLPHAGMFTEANFLSVRAFIAP